MTLLQAIGPFILCLLLLWPLAGMRRWLQQHLFKVGWLVTKNLHTTTILFYTLFLPGLLVYELVFWLFAGVLNIRAERAISWPEAQQIAELKLNFIKVEPRKVGRFRLALIHLAPFVVGTAIIWGVAFNVLSIDAAVATISEQGLRGSGTALSQIFSAPDVFLWIYFLFTIGNTMMPRWEDIKGLRILLIGAAVAMGGFLLFGVADDVFVNGVLTPLNSALSLIAGVFAVIIGVNLLVTAVLGAIESTIERITGDSATFEKGKLVALTRAELIELKRKAEEAEAKARKVSRERKPAVSAGPPTIYRLQLPLPPLPGGETVTVRRDDEHALPPAKPSAPPPAAAQPSLFGTPPTAPPATKPEPTSPLPAAPPAIKPEPASPLPAAPPAIKPEPASPPPTAPPAIKPEPASPLPTAPPAIKPAFSSTAPIAPKPSPPLPAQDDDEDEDEGSPLDDLLAEFGDDEDDDYDDSWMEDDDDEDEEK